MGIIKNPTGQDNTGILTTSQYSSVSSIKFQSGIDAPTAGFDDLIGRHITQNRVIDNVSVTARGIITSYDEETFVLKYIQDRSLNLNPETNDTTDFEEINSRGQVFDFESSSPIQSSGFAVDKTPDGNFSGITTTINNKQINLGVNFQNGLAAPEINKKTGDIIYIDNRKEVTRNIRQKEDVKIILEF